MGRSPYVLGLLSGDGYQVFATLPGEFATEDMAIRAAQDDYLSRFGGAPTFRIYQVAAATPGPRLTLIEVSYDETKLRSFVALYKVIEAPRAALPRTELPDPSCRPVRPFRERVAALLARFFPGPTALDPAMFIPGRLSLS